MDPKDPLIPTQPAPTAARPLLGLTVLVIEDSRFSCEAMRLLCLRSGARIRRADSLKAARRHLQVYRPSVVIVDMGLPDGSGSDLIEELSEANPRPEVILGTSGDPEGEAMSMASGADGFLDKPISSLAAFQNMILQHLPEDRRPRGPRVVSDETITPDPIAFQDDMAHIADVLAEPSSDNMLDYVVQFLGGVARSAHDSALEAATEALARKRAAGGSINPERAMVIDLLQERIEQRIAI